MSRILTALFMTAALGAPAFAAVHHRPPPPRHPVHCHIHHHHKVCTR